MYELQQKLQQEFFDRMNDNLSWYNEEGYYYQEQKELFESNEVTKKDIETYKDNPYIKDKSKNGILSALKEVIDPFINRVKELLGVQDNLQIPPEEQYQEYEFGLAPEPDTPDEEEYLE